jgi:hypothetical protein
MADSSESTREEKITDALRAAPAYIADSATVVDWDMTTVLREGLPDWTCVHTPPDTPWPAPMCLDPTFMQWFREVAEGRTPTIDRIGISYMLMGEVGADFDHPEYNHPPRGQGLVSRRAARDVCLPRRHRPHAEGSGTRRDVGPAVCAADSRGGAAARRSSRLAGRNDRSEAWIHRVMSST